MSTVAAVEYLEAPSRHPPAAVCVVFGAEEFLKRQALAQLRKAILGTDGDFSLTRYEGPGATWQEVHAELATRAMFGDKRLALVEEADKFVAAYRAELEGYVAKPRATAVLVLETLSWASNTRLYKAVAASGLQIECKEIDSRRLVPWLASWAKRSHGLEISPAAAQRLVEMIGGELGLLDQELIKLASASGPRHAIDVAAIDRFVSWRATTAWVMLDAALDGNLAQALVELDRLVLAGENAVAVLAQIAASLRRLAAAHRKTRQAKAGSVQAILKQVGVHPYFLAKSEQQLRRLGPQRAEQLYRWLLEADLGLKGASRLDPQTILERLLVRLAADSAARQV